MPAYLDFWYQSQDGLQLYAREYPHESPAATIVCIPGLTRNSADFAEFCQQLNQEYRIFAVDLRGRGRSDYDPVPQNYHPSVYVQDIQALLDKLDLNEVILIGTSLGGLVSMLLSAMNPERVRALVINDIGPEINPSGLERIKSYVQSKPAPIEDWDQAQKRTQQALRREYPNFTDKDWQLFAQRLYKQSNGSIQLDYDPAISVLFDDQKESMETLDLWPVFDSLSPVPMMTIRGELSDILLPETTSKMQQMHPKFTLLEVPEVGHTPLFEDPQVTKKVVNFLAHC